MAKHTRHGTDNSTAARILAGLRQRITRLEQRDRHTEESALNLRVTSETARSQDLVHIEAIEHNFGGGFGTEPFGEDFGSVTDETDEDDEPRTVYDREITNTTTHGYQEYITEATLPGVSNPSPPTALALGDGTNSFSPGNTSLNRQFGTSTFTTENAIDGGRTALFQTQIDTNELIGETIREVGIVTQDGRLINHAPVDPSITKTDSMEITFEIHLRVRE